VLAAGVDRAALGLRWPEGHRWELELNTIKTYPCGVVAHPAMDAAIIASALDCVIAIDEAGLVLEFNPAAERTFGRRRADVRAAREVAPPAPRRYVVSAICYVVQKA